MGVPRFFKFVTENWPMCIKRVYRSFGSDVDNLYLDLNGIIHVCANSVYFPEHADEELQGMTPQKKERYLFKKIGSTINLLVNFCKPKNLLYIAIDGVAPLAKQTQQRQRRYKGALVKTREQLDIFDSACITPGTVFMKRLNSYMHYFIRKMCDSHKSWTHLRVIFSGSGVPGEGEHKIINYVKSLDVSDALSHCMYGLDADLFMLGLSTHLQNFYLLREDQYSKDMTNFYKVELHTLADEICKIKPSAPKRTVINDFILMTFLLGNDFVHAPPGLQFLEPSIKCLLDIYSSLPELTLTMGTGSNTIFNLMSFITLLKHWEPLEKLQIEASLNLLKFPDPILNSCLLEDRQVDVHKYKAAYYKHAGITHVSEFCAEYVQGLEWIHNYYHTSTRNWKWTFPYHYSPFLSDVLTFLCTNPKISRPSQITASNISVDQQLICVIPPQSRGLLPDYLQKYYEPTHTFKKYMPTIFEIDVAGKQAEWMGIAKIPFITIDEIIAGTQSDPQSDKIEHTIEFKFSSSYTKPFKSFYGEIPACHVRASYI